MSRFTSTEMANTVAGDLYRSPDEIIKAIEEFAKGPHLIGNLMGLLVYVDKRPPGAIEFHHGDGRVQRVSVDHPYLKGTKIEAAARRALGE